MSRFDADSVAVGKGQELGLNDVEPLASAGGEIVLEIDGLRYPFPVDIGCTGLKPRVSEYAPDRVPQPEEGSTVLMNQKAPVIAHTK